MSEEFARQVYVRAMQTLSEGDGAGDKNAQELYGKLIVALNAAHEERPMQFIELVDGVTRLLSCVVMAAAVAQPPEVRDNAVKSFSTSTGVYVAQRLGVLCDIAAVEHKTREGQNDG